MNPAWYLGLPAAAWLIYLCDHLMDSTRNPNLHTPRHAFIRNNQTQIIILAGLLIVLCSYLAITYYTTPLFLSAFVLVLFCGIYFGLTSISNPIFRYFYNKELMVAIIYATAIYITVGLSAQNKVVWLLYYGLLISITYLNLLMVSIIEYEEDVANQQFSWVIMIGTRRATILFYSILTATCGTCLWLVVVQSRELSLLAAVYLAMALLHGFIFIKESKLMQHRAYRKYSEALFWLPILAYLLAQL